MSSIFFGGSLLAAVIAGTIALFAPCCISVMLPAYFAGSFPNRGVLVAMTFIFGAGVATIILPLAMGASLLRQLITEQHLPVYVGAGLVMIVLAGYLLSGGEIHLPMPGRRGGATAGPLSVYTLGAFSGVTSACCAPVLAGVIALSGIASSFLAALALGAAYVFGMVAPLFVISVLWEQFDWRTSGVFRRRAVDLHLGPLKKHLSVSNLASGLLLAVMGVGTVIVGLQGEAMPADSGWQYELAVRVGHYGQLASAALAKLPSWAAAVVLALIVAALVRLAIAEVFRPPRGQQSQHSAGEAR